MGKSLELDVKNAIDEGDVEIGEKNDWFAKAELEWPDEGFE